MATTPATTGECLGVWNPDGVEVAPRFEPEDFRRALLRVADPVWVCEIEGSPAVCQGGVASIGPGVAAGDGHPLLGFAPALAPERLGDAEFRDRHGLRFAYVAGEMANAIGSEEIVEAMGRAGMIGFFGAAGCSLERVERAIDRIEASLGSLPFGFNLIHSPSEPILEDAVVDLYVRRRVHLVSASAYLDLTLPLVRYRVTGIRAGSDGVVIAPNRVIAKVSRVEVARRFLSPPPTEMLAALVEQGVISGVQARLAATIPMADDLTAEADSGGHTDNRPALSLIPTMIALRDRLAAQHGYRRRIHVGAAGGIATPASVAAAFAMGASYVMTGSINQACVEAGTSDTVRNMLAQAEQADVAMAPAADMFEMGVNVQVLKRGTMFAMRARKLYELYRAHDSLDAIPPDQRAMLERDWFRQPLEAVWSDTRVYFEQRDPSQVERAERDEKHKMALVFRSYLGRSSTWANRGEPTRKLDYQVWCGPAMGAFNEWTRGTFLAQPENRDVTTVARNLLLGAAFLTRAGWLRAQGVPLPAGADQFKPLTPSELSAYPI